MSDKTLNVTTNSSLATDQQSSFSLINSTHHLLSLHVNKSETSIWNDSTLNTSIIQQERNATRQSHFLEPIPDWQRALSTWGSWGWGLHTYGLGSLFIMLDVFLIVTLIQLRRRLCSQPLLLLVSGLLMLLAGVRALYLLIDPYSSSGCLPYCLLRMMYGLAFPCLTTAFCLIQIVLLRMTKVKGPLPTCKHYQSVSFVLTGHFTMVVIIEVIVCKNTSLKLLMLLTQAFFITWGLVLCFGFIYNGFKLAQFTNETKRALEQLVAYNKVRREILKDGNRRELALHRISKPKIRTEEEERQGLSDDNGSCSSDLAGSSESLSFFNEAHLVFDEHVIEEAYKNALVNSKRPKHCDRENNNHNNHSKLHLTATTSNYDISSESEYVTDTPTISPHNGQGRAIINTTPQVQNTPPHNRYTYYNPGYTEMRYAGKQPSSVTFRNKCFSSPFVTNGYVPFNVEPVKSSASGEKIILEATNESAYQPEESGYTADTEFYSPRPKKKSKGAKNKDVDKQQLHQDDLTSSPVRKPYNLPDNDGSLGLYRIRQGQILRKALHVTYVSTLLGFVCCVLQLYAMFGVYGVLSNEEVADPWSWYCFQTATRLVELGIGYSIAYTIFILSCQRYRPPHKKRRTPDPDRIGQTIC